MYSEYVVMGYWRMAMGGARSGLGLRETEGSSS